jgi:hypothetical protein
MPSLRLLSATLAGVLPLAAVAQEGEGTEGNIQITREGAYQGVTPGSKKSEMPKPPKKRPGKPTVTWIGFQPLEGGSARVFVQASHNFTYIQSVAGDELVVSMPDVKLGNYNFQRFMDTSFFDAPLKIVRAKPMKKRGVEIHIKFKGGGARQGDARLEQAQDGYHYLFLDFGASGGSGG